MSYKIFKTRRTIFIFCILSLLLFFAVCMKLFSNEKLSVDQTNKLKQQMIDESIANYPGKCACPYQIMSNGKRCGKFSAYSKLADMIHYVILMILLKILLLLIKI